MALRTTINRKNSGKVGANFLTYPDSLGTLKRHDHYVMFFINMQSNSTAKVNFGQRYDSTYRPDGSTLPGSTNKEATTLSIKRAPTKRLSQAIALYMPAQLSLNHTANYGEPEIGALTAFAMSSIGTISSDVSVGEMVKKIGAEAVSEAGTAFGQALLALGDATVTPGVKAAAEIAMGKVVNNRTEMSFEGIGRRSFSFSFKMLPNNAKEAETIEEIVTSFRFHAMPEIEGDNLAGRTMIPPSTFDIEYFPNTHLHRISTSVLESVDIKYGGERTQFFTDDQPVETELTLQFKELEIITKERVLAGF